MNNNNHRTITLSNSFPSKWTKYWCWYVFFGKFPSLRTSFRSSHRDYFRKFLFFSSRSTFFWIFPESLFMCSSNRYQFSRKTWSVHRTYTNFPGSLFMCSPNRYQFSRSTCLATEQITIFQEAFFKYQRTDRQFPGRYPNAPSEQIFQQVSNNCKQRFTLPVILVENSFTGVDFTNANLLVHWLSFSLPPTIYLTTILVPVVILGSFLAHNLNPPNAFPLSHRKVPSFTRSFKPSQAWVIFSFLVYKLCTEN